MRQSHYQQGVLTGSSYSGEETVTVDRDLTRQMGWCPMQNAWVVRWTGEGKGLAGHEGEETGTGNQPRPLFRGPNGSEYGV
jgi:hypothetical protein